MSCGTDKELDSTLHFGTFELTFPHGTQRISQRMQRTLVNHNIIWDLLIRILPITLRLSSFTVRPDHSEEGLIRSIIVTLALQRYAFQSADDRAVCLFRIPLLVLFNLAEGVLRAASLEFVWKGRLDLKHRQNDE
jgi:hypothetical protein